MSALASKPKSMYLNNLTMCERSKIMNNIIYFSRTTTPFSLQKNSLKMLNFRVFYL